MSDEERTEERHDEDVEAHGPKKVVATGLAGAALIGAGAVGVKLATDDDSNRNTGALVSPTGVDERLAKADTDRDGYVTYQDLEAVGYKYDAELLKVEGYDVSAEALAAAGHKVELALVDKERGWELEGETIKLRSGVSEELDELAKGGAEEWMKKIRPLDRDEDGYLDYEALAEAGHKLIIKGELDEVADKHVEIKELYAAGVKIKSADLGEGGFAMEEDAIYLRYGVDEKLDAFIKH
jgi:hypothetical protein